jgi:hypothetical protein
VGPANELKKPWTVRMDDDASGTHSPASLSCLCFLRSQNPSMMRTDVMMMLLERNYQRNWTPMR